MGSGDVTISYLKRFADLLAGQDKYAVDITGGSIANVTLENIDSITLDAPLSISQGGTGEATDSAARAALGLEIGVDVQAYSAGLASIAGLTTAADKGIYATASNVYAVFDLTAAGRALLDDANAGAQRTTLGLGTAATYAFIDEDNMASNSDTALPSQQSVKAYVDGKTYSSSNVSYDPAVSGLSATNVKAAIDELAAGAGKDYEFVSSATASNSASIDFVGLESGYSYIFEVQCLRPASDGAVPWARTSTNGGSSYDSGASDYEVSTTEAAQVILGPAVGNAADEHHSNIITLINPGGSTEKIIIGTPISKNTLGVAEIGFLFGGIRKSTTAVNAVRFLFSTGNITSGTIYMFRKRLS